jgi:hypothetical protein
MSLDLIADRWGVDGLLNTIATADPPFHALIDTGALVTGYTNYEVALYLLQHGLKDMDGVVFLDSLDRQMILLRTGWIVMELWQSGLGSPRMAHRRFTFYDQVRTVWMSLQGLQYCARISEC